MRTRPLIFQDLSPAPLISVTSISQYAPVLFTSNRKGLSHSPQHRGASHRIGHAVHKGINMQQCIRGPTLQLKYGRNWPHIADSQCSQCSQRRRVQLTCLVSLNYHVSPMVHCLQQYAQGRYTIWLVFCHHFRAFTSSNETIGNKVFLDRYPAFATSISSLSLIVSSRNPRAS